MWWLHAVAARGVQLCNRTKHLFQNSICQNWFFIFFPPAETWRLRQQFLALNACMYTTNNSALVSYAFNVVTHTHPPWHAMHVNSKSNHQTSLASPHTHNSGQSPQCFMVGQAHHNSVWRGKWKNGSSDVKTRGSQREKTRAAVKRKGEIWVSTLKYYQTGSLITFLLCLCMTKWTKHLQK